MAEKDERPVSVLTESELIAIMREEWDVKIKGIIGELDTTHRTASGEESTTMSPGLKVKHKESGLLYTVDSLGMRDIVLRNPEGEMFTVNHETLEKEYELD